MQEYRTLIVDDEPAVSEGLKLKVNWKDCGFRQPNCAFNYNEALDKLEEDKYHLVITDIRMPGLSGLDLLAEMKKIAPNIKVIILSCYDNFEYAKKALEYGVEDYLLKPVDRHELADCLNKVKEELDRECEERNHICRNLKAEKKRFLYQLVCGTVAPDELAHNLINYKLKNNHTGYCLALCEIDNYDGMLSKKSSEIGNSREIIENLMEEFLIQRNMGNVYEDDDGLIGLLLYGWQDQFNVSAIEQSLKDIAKLVEAGTEKTITFGYGNIVSCLENIKISRRNAMDALVKKFVLPDHKIIPFDKTIIGASSLLQINWTIQPLLDAIKCYDIKAIREQCCTVIQELKKKSFPAYQISDILLCITSEVNRIVQQQGKSSEPLFQQPPGDSPEENDVPFPEYNDWLFKQCKLASETLQESAASKEDFAGIDKIKKYIDENYMKTLSIKEISRVFYMNPAYLGQLFRKSVGETIKEYINKKKIAEIKRLTASGNVIIHEAICKAGFNNQGYFYKKFRQYEGIPFSEYNRKIKEAKQRKSK